jgi:hypothetical protein
MASRFYVTGHLGTDSVSERFLALDATVKSGKPPEFRVLRFRKDLSAKPDFVRALELEATAELPLSHVNILKLTATGVWDGSVFFAYERTDSVSLSDAWKNASGMPLEPAIVAGIAVPLLDALIYAHSGADDPRSRRPRAFQTAFTPHAVEITRAGTVKVRGFGTAALKDTRRPNAVDLACGRAPYLAQSILDGGEATVKTDLFSLGTLLWELLTGQPLFKKNSAEERGREAPQVSSISPLVRAELDSFVARLLIRDPDFQFKDATEAKATLEKALFAADAQADQKAFLSWCESNVRPNQPKDRKVLAEIVGSRELAKSLAAPTAASEPAEPSPAPQAERRKVPRPTAADHTPWEGTTTTTKFLADEPDERPKLRGPAVPKGLLALFFLVLALGFAGAGAYIFFPDSFSLNGALGSAVDGVRALLPASGGEDAQKLPAIFAFREKQDRRVYVQGLRQEAENYFVPCGENGEKCKCDFFLAPDDTAPLATAPAGVSRKFNYVYCDLPEDATAMFVRVVSAGEKPRKTNILQIVNNLSWPNLLGAALLKQRVRWVSRYECDRTFLEGEDVVPDGSKIGCSPLQHLSILSATLSYYVYKSDEGSNKPGESTDFKHDVCGITNLTKIRCQSDGFVPQFGVYKESTPPFVVPVSVFRAPDSDDPISDVGYAAGPDSKGNCPVGFALVKQWLASAPSITENTDGAGGYPTNFTNKAGELSDHAFAQIEPRPFVVTLRRNRTPCDGKGDCSLAAFEDARPALTVPYKLTGSFCALPAALLTDPPPEGGTGRVFGGTAEKAPEMILELHTSMPGPELMLNGKKVGVVNGTVRAPLHVEIKLDAAKAGYKTQHLTLPAFERAGKTPVDIPSEKIETGAVDLDSFPRSEVTFWRGEEKVFTGTTPVKENFPAGTYKVKFKTLRTGTEAEKEVVVQENKTTVVDQLIREKN